MRLGGVVAALLLFAGAACSGPAWTTLTGRVVVQGVSFQCQGPAPAGCKQFQNAAAGIAVTAISSPDKQRYNTRTRQGGQFSLNLPGGDYDLYAASIKLARVTMVGYPAEKRYIEVTLPYPVPLAAPHG